jgi:DNA invertase Pin-like site-specific DNA recombinase
MIYLYIRRSRQTQELSVERQTALLEEWARDNKVKPDRVFIEEPVSGASRLRDRPALSSLMAIVDKGDKIVCADMTRLSRNTMVFNMIMGLVDNAGAEIIFADGHQVDSDDLVSMLMTSILAWTSQWEREQISSRTKQALAIVRQTKALGSPSTVQYGYKNENGKKVPVPAEQKIGKLILDMKAQGYKLKDIKSALDKANMTTRTGKPYSINGISHLSRKFVPA